jgi:alpha-L-fucosidase 2
METISILTYKLMQITPGVHHHKPPQASPLSGMGSERDKPTQTVYSRCPLATPRGHLMRNGTMPTIPVLQEYIEVEPQHRHVSHLWGLYPGDEISPYTTPKLAQAARKSLEVRGDDGVGWSLAYKAALWARLGDGDHAWRLVRKALVPVVTQEIRYDNGGGVYANLFDACPPYQIDGNFGVTAAIGEMLLQSQMDRIELLPALPYAWKDGKVSGLRARGGFQVDIAWQDGKLSSATIHSDTGEPCSVSYGGKTIEVKTKKGGSITLNGGLGFN